MPGSIQSILESLYKWLAIFQMSKRRGEQNKVNFSKRSLTE